MINLPRPDASVAMQFGTKPEPDNMQVDFNRVYQELIVPALEAAGLEVVRATRSDVPATSAPTCSMNCWSPTWSWPT